MKTANRILLVLVGILLSACSSSQLEPIDFAAISAVQAEIKSQVSIYMSLPKAKDDPPMVMIDGVPTSVYDEEKTGGFWCGRGRIGFDLTSVKAELTTTFTNSVGFTAGATLPVAGIPLSATAGAKSETTNTQVLTYNLWSLPGQQLSQADLAKEFAKAPIAQVLRDLRNALIVSAMVWDYSGPKPVKRPQQACFRTYNPDKPTADAGNTFKLGLSFTRSVNGGISIKLTILTLGATAEAKSVTGNTLTVSFVQSELSEIQMLKEAVDTDCKYPKRKYDSDLKKVVVVPECQKALDALAGAERGGIGVAAPPN
jgi:hypothetical protein